MEENRKLERAEQELAREKELTPKEKQVSVDEFVQAKFPDRGHQWINSHTRDVNGKQILTAPLPVVIDKLGEPQWLNRKERRYILRKAGTK